MKIIHAADLHVDSPMVGVERYPGVPVDVLRGATREAFKNLIGMVLEEGAELLLLAGDLFDDNWRDYATGLYFLNELGRLREVGTKVVLVRGNHDAQSHVTKHLRWPDHVKELSVKKPETWEDARLGVAVHGQGYAQRETTGDLAAGYPAPRSSLLNIGLLHTSLDGREGHASYAPTSARILAAKGYDYWALGHVHAREVVQAGPHIVFPGNLQGRSVRETGAKGATKITVQDGEIREVAHVPLDVVRWAVLDVDATNAEDDEAVLSLVSRALADKARDLDSRLGVARVRIKARRALFGRLIADEERVISEVRRIANESTEEAWVTERVKLELAREDRDELTADIGPLFASGASGASGAVGPSPRVDDALVARAKEKLKGLYSRMPDAAQRALPLADDATVSALLAEAEAFLARALDEDKS